MINPEYFVQANIYCNKEAVIQDALRYLLRYRPELKIQLAVYKYQNEDISLEKAANIAGLSWVQMKDILMEKGISLRLGSETIQEAREEILTLREELAVS